MLFSSTIFLFIFFPLSFIVHSFLNFSRRSQNVWLCIVSIIFYAWGEPVYVLLLLLSGLFNWAGGNYITKQKEKGKNSNPFFVAVCILNIGLLFLFKLFAPLITDLSGKWILPIGLSFYTFHAVSYIVDIYRGDIKSEKNFLHVMLYLSFFPKVLAGPFIRYGTFQEQIQNRRITYRTISVGACRFAVGFFKKVLLAGNLANLADLVFNYSAMGWKTVQVPAAMAWLGAIAFALQIYFDISSYSDMAIGLAFMFGFRLEENFDNPYMAVSIREFWKKWHITFMNWFREYVYYPLGGSSSSNKDKMIRNMLILWLCIGIFHGAESTFLLWGIWHFFFHMIEYFLGYAENSRKTVLLRFYTWTVVLLGWILFRAQDLYQAGRFYMNMFALNHNGLLNETTGFLLKEYWMFLLAGMIMCTPIAKKINNRLVSDQLGRLGKIFTYGYPIVMMLVFILSLSYLMTSGSSAFIYFNF